MTAGIRSQQIAGTTVALPRTALAGLMGVALLVGGVLGVVTKSEFDSIAAHAASAQVASSLESRLLTQGSQITVGRGPLVRDPGVVGPQSQASVHAADHIGLTERLFPVTSGHHIEHGPLP